MGREIYCKMAQLLILQIRSDKKLLIVSSVGEVTRTLTHSRIWRGKTEPMADTLDIFTRQYLETALWASTDDTGEALDTDRDARNFAPEALARAEADCAKFQAEHAADIASDPGQAGHDFWLTRNGHGAGFWDGDWPEPAATRLTAASQAFGAVDLCLGDDGKVYMTGE